ncbi:MAG: motility associated factor glycosyltransferase family protein [Tissierella sp.]|nr:motility associated factor glycosyltransferase family protein [Tissierella sp.]
MSSINNNKTYKIIETKIPNTPTIQAILGEKSFYLYSKYDPMRDSNIFAEEEYDENVDNYLVYGLGLGYHIRQLENRLKEKNHNYHIYVIECNPEIYRLATKNVNLDGLINNENISFILMRNNKESYNRLNRILAVDNIKVSNHLPSLNIIPDEFMELRYLLEEFQVKKDSIDAHSYKLDNNFKININNYDENVEVLFNKFKDMPLYLIAAGPSLDRNIHDLAKIKGKGIILSVGRAVRSLLAANVVPDYIVITDPSDFLYDMQLKGLDIDIPIIVLSTCDKNVMLNYRGKKYIALQKGFVPAEIYAKEKNSPLIKTGGSVATTGLDIAIAMGCNPIVFVGQDLAFSKNQTHSKDTFSKAIVDSNSLRDVEDIYSNTIKTSKNLYSYLRWIENRISQERQIQFIDATEGGARIKGTRVMKLEDTIALRYK